MILARRPLRTLIGLLFIVVLAGGGFALWVRKSVTTAFEHESADRIVTIDPAPGSDNTGRLAEAGVSLNHSR